MELLSMDVLSVALMQALADASVRWMVAEDGLGVMAGLVMLGYGVTAWACFACGHAARQAGASARGWYVCAGLLGFLALETLLQSHVFVLELLRAFSRAMHWYDARRGMQFQLLAAACVVVLLLLGWLRGQLDAVWHDCAPTVIGIVLLIGLYLLRAVSFHDADAVMDLQVAGVSLSRMGELCGISLTALGAQRWLRVW